MKKMTKVISLALALVMCLALCACGSKKEASYKMLDEKVSTEQYAIGFKKGNTELRDAVQAALFQLYKDGKVEEIAKKYSDYNLDAMLCLDKQTETTFDAAQASDEFRWEAFDDAREMKRHLLGAVLMGAGGVLCGGCTIGQGITAGSLMALSCPLAVGGMIVGARLGIAFLVEGRALFFLPDRTAARSRLAGGRRLRS